jgi:hypothetical protein
VITIVSGAPCSGKSTYIRQQSKPGDVVVDLERLSSALSIGVEDGHLVPEYIAHIAIGARNGAVRRAVRLRESAKGVDVWIIHTAPKPADLAAYRIWKAEVVVIDPGKDVCLERASRLRPHTAQVIEDWYSGKLHRPRPMVLKDDEGDMREDL